MEQEENRNVHAGGGNWYGGQEASTLNTRSAPINNTQYPNPVHEGNEQLFRTMFELATTGIVCMQPQGQFVLVNQYCCNLLGYKKEELLARTFNDIIHPSDRGNVVASLLRNITKQPGSSLEKRLLRQDGSTVWVNLSASTIAQTSDTPSYLLLFFDDITARKQLEEERAQLSEEIALASTAINLTGLVMEREQLLQEQEVLRAKVDTLNEANKRMYEFLDIACHELKTPLAAIKGNIQLAERRFIRLMRQQDKSPDALLPELLENANGQTDRLDRLVSDLLDVSRIQAGRFEMHNAVCDLKAIVSNAVQDQQLIWPNRKLLLEVPLLEKMPIFADAVRIGQVVTNLLTNAIRYSQEERPIEIALLAEESVARVVVRDQGPGFPPEEKGHLWEQFYRVKGIAVQCGSGVSLGLGLYISRIIIERHDGHIDADSVPGQGSVFWFTHPLINENAV